MTGHVDTERILDAFLAPEADRLADRVMDAALLDIGRIRQRHALRVPWRFPHMPVLTRATGLAAAALVAAVGAGGLYLASNGTGGPGGPGSPLPTTTATATTPTVAPTVAQTLPPGIPAWSTYTSKVYSYALEYPSDWRIVGRATQRWQPGATDEAFDSFTNGDIAFIVWQMPLPAGADITAPQAMATGLSRFCDAYGWSSCEPAEAPRQFCIGPDGLAETSTTVQGCWPAIVAMVGYTGDETPTAFVGNPKTGSITVVNMGRAEGYSGARNYGGTTALLLSILGQLRLE